MKSITYPLSLLNTPVWLFDIDRLRIVWANTAAVSLWNASTLYELQQRDMADGISRTVLERLNQHYDDLTGNLTSVAEHWTFYPRGRPCSFECFINALDAPEGERWLLVNASSEDKASDSDTLYRSSALLHTSVSISVFDRHGMLKYLNPAARRMLGANLLTLPERFVDRQDWHLARDKLTQMAETHIEAQMVTANGTAWHSMTLELCPDPVTGNSSILMSEQDVSDRREAQLRVHQLAYSDTLTGLPNRTSWLNKLTERLDIADDTQQRLGILFVDLDRFKLINDTLGHAVGDKLLVAVARRLSGCVDGDQYLARLGGDEFTLLIKENTAEDHSTEMAMRIVKSLAAPMNIDGHVLSVTPSIGISLYPEHGSDANQLMQQADLAMYAAKESGGGVRVFQPRMTTQIQRRLLIENQLREAIDKKILQVYYQPKLHTSDGHVIGMEALIRWEHPTLGWVSPTDFIAVAEETGMIGEITQLVLYEAMRQQTRWAAEGYEVSVAVNVSPVEFRQGDFVAIVREALSVTGCCSKFVELEITESMLMADSSTIQTILASLTSLGVRLSIDDFGSGYSNLGYLQKFPLDSLKIDRTFLSDGEISPVIDMIIGIARTLCLTVVAEGVETIEQREFLIAHGCDQLQGFLFAKPLQELHATQFLKTYAEPGNRWSHRAIVST
ncbi:putative bifunctional diguanylate cyclase/phosphodiesterase [Granulosicoccus antarcticus]|nr:bifunctional diguanylate cyclase/phosphodiesterase [Granulosicoccus antarcticus]